MRRPYANWTLFVLAIVLVLNWVAESAKGRTTARLASQETGVEPDAEKGPLNDDRLYGCEDRACSCDARDYAGPTYGRWHARIRGYSGIPARVTPWWLGECDNGP
ncbi:MAG: hypothetical protein FJ295_11455 [Planctomycetes bacterium]|nr:hypothetical protein [Planctomycetota bacterium]